jgi:hypothetical protein
MHHQKSKKNLKFSSQSQKNTKTFWLYPEQKQSAAHCLCLPRVLKLTKMTVFYPSTWMTHKIQKKNIPPKKTNHGAIVFPFSVDDKESNSSGDGKGKTTTSNSNNPSKSVNSNDSTTTDKTNSTSKATSSTATVPNSDQTAANSEKSENNCDANSDVMNSVIDTSGIKVEIKDDPDAPKSVNNIQPALGGSLLPPHAANAKHPVSITLLFTFASRFDEF